MNIFKCKNEKDVSEISISRVKSPEKSEMIAAY
jgi:hypothetical protein